ncbi:MAG: hypothetical protein HZA53_02995 [Planctomycetes bacterium]|nr:hypothetical protein [Planctomycetota bacterium]
MLLHAAAHARREERMDARRRGKPRSFPAPRAFHRASQRERCGEQARRAGRQTGLLHQLFRAQSRHFSQVPNAQETRESAQIRIAAEASLEKLHIGKRAGLARVFPSFVSRSGRAARFHSRPFSKFLELARFSFPHARDDVRRMER